MSPVIIGVIGFIVLFSLLAFGVPIGISMGVVGLAGLWHMFGVGSAAVKLVLVPLDLVMNYSFAVLPLFLLMAHICFQAGISTDLYNVASKWLGHQRGGIGMATVGASAGFAAMSASSTATVATIGLVALPEMKRLKYDSALAAGTVAAGGTMGILIPPSSTMIIYGIMTETSIGQLFLAGMIPGILEALFYIVVIYIICRLRPEMGPRGPKSTMKEKIMVLGSCGELIALVMLVLGGLIIGWFTPTEAGAIGSGGAILFSLIRRRINWSKFREALMETMKTTGMIYAILIGALILRYFVTITTIPTHMAQTVGGLPFPPTVIMICIFLVYIFLGCFLDAMAMLLLTLPIFFPLVTGMGYSEVWFGIFMVRMIEIAMVTPPIGLNLFVVAGIAPDLSIQTIYRGIFPFVLADVCHITLLLLVPDVALFLPRLLFGA
ncbi:MAG: TRAP transporter large permease [Deltaproteobacteria bacterium]|nr:TRAP transporter large permease [Deltaproteobacteria bacterium]